MIMDFRKTTFENVPRLGKRITDDAFPDRGNPV